MRRLATLTFILATAAAPLAAQAARAGDAAARAAAATITEADYRRRIAIIADDSMRGRGTPSPELDLTAQHIAGEFQRFGLRPGGDDGSFIQRYPIQRSRLDTAQSFVMAMGRGVHGHWQIGRDAALAGTVDGRVPSEPVNGPLVLVAGAPADTARPFGAAPQGAIALMVLRGPGLSGINQYVGKARAAGIRAVVALVAMSGEQFAGMVRGASASETMDLARDYGNVGIPVFVVRDSSALELLRAAGEDLGALRAGQGAGVRPLAGFTGSATVRRTVLSAITAPNVIGILEGSDPQLRNEYVVFMAHMDHVGMTGRGQPCRAVGADSTCNGADDDASGTTGVVMLAQAYARMSPRPRRSLVFITVSGEERGLWGSEWYSEHPTVSMAGTVAGINLDMIGRNWRDTIAVIGKEHSTLGETANRIAREHPELNMALVDDIWPNENFYYRSDHYNLARKGVPILFFFNGTHPDYHRVSDSVDKIDAEKAARIVQMVFYLGLDVANTTARPQWNPESRSRIVEAME